MRKTEETFLLEPERYEFRAMPDAPFALGRRDFFKILARGWPCFAVAKNVSAMQEPAPGPHGYHPEELPKEIGGVAAYRRGRHGHRFRGEGGDWAERTDITGTNDCR